MKRYSIDEEFHGLGVMVGDPSGDYVKQEDAQKLVELNKELVQLLNESTALMNKKRHEKLLNRIIWVLSKAKELL